MELKEYISPLRKWWWLIVLATLVASAASFFVASRQPNNYRARSTLMIGRAIDNPNPSGTEFWLTQQLAQTYAEIAKREPVRARTMEALRLEWLPEYAVRALPETQLIEIAVTDTSPERARAVADELANQLILQSPTSPEQDEQSRQAFIGQQLDELEQSITKTRNEIADKQDELASVSSARQIAEVENEIAALQAKLTTLQSNYADLLSNTRSGAINTLSVIEPAMLPTAPVGPHMAITVLVAGVIGFIVSAGAAYLIEYLDDSVGSVEDVRRAAGLPTLAGIARISEDPKGSRLVALTQPRSPTSEAYRVLRTGIQFSSIDSPERATLMITSANPSEGKSLTVANLAIVIAQAGHNVLIVDADLRRPVQHKLFGASKARGLTSALLQMSRASNESESLDALRRSIQKSSVPRLHVLSSGPSPPNPSELLGSAKMELMQKILSKFYDFLIIDSPPVLAVTDAMVLSRLTDGVLLVSDAGRTRRGALKQAAEQLQGGNAHVIGVVLNRLSSRSDGYYTYYTYRSTYYLDETSADESPPQNGNGRGRLPWQRRGSKGVAAEQQS